VTTVLAGGWDARRVGADFHIRLPESIPDSRLATLAKPASSPLTAHPRLP